MASTAASVSLDEYLATCYRPDVELIQGQLKEKPVVSPLHGRAQVILALWFEQRRAEWGVQTVVETRTQVNDDDVRLPDICVLPKGPLPRKALRQPPLIAIEVLSETDRYADLKARARDLSTMGVKDIWLIDPSALTADVWIDGGWAPATKSILTTRDGAMHLDLAWLWAELGPQE